MDEENPITALLEGEIRVVEISALKENPDNPKGISKGQLAKLRESLGVLGYLIPILVNKDYVIIDGHQRVKALREKGYERVEVRIVDLDEDSELLALLASDETYGTIDREKREELYILLRERNARLDILSGYNDHEEEATKNFEKGQEVDEMNTKDIEYGQVIELGEHRLICGDSTDPDIWAKVKEIGTPYAVITSPPYYNQREYSHWDDIESYIKTMDEVFKLASDLMEEGIWFINIGMDIQYNLPAMFDELCTNNGYSYLDCIAWYKPNLNMNIPRFKQIRANHLYYPAYQWEPCLVYTRGLRHKIDLDNVNKVHSELLSNVWKITTIRGDKRIHPAQFPIELAEKAMMAYTSKGDTIIDPFAGSGTTILAGERMQRKVIAIEISPEYCSEIIARWNRTYEQRE